MTAAQAINPEVTAATSEAISDVRAENIFMT